MRASSILQVELDSEFNVKKIQFSLIFTIFPQFFWSLEKTHEKYAQFFFVIIQIDYDILIT